MHAGTYQQAHCSYSIKRTAPKRKPLIEPARLVRSVMKLSNLLALSSCLVSTTPAWGRIWSGSASPRMEEAVNFQLEHLENMRSFLGPTDDFMSSHMKRDSAIQFHNPRAKNFLVDGAKLPLGASCYAIDMATTPHGCLIVSWDAGPSWAGLLPISSDPHETRKLFFWYVLPCFLPLPLIVLTFDRFWPTTNASNANDLVFWTQGSLPR